MVGLEVNNLVEDAHIADLLILEKAGAVYAVEAGAVELRYNESIDLGRKLFAVEFDVAAAHKLADGQKAKDLLVFALNRGALAAAAPRGCLRSAHLPRRLPSTRLLAWSG